MKVLLAVLRFLLRRRRRRPPQPTPPVDPERLQRIYQETAAEMENLRRAA